MDKRIWISSGQVTRTEHIDPNLTLDKVEVRGGDSNTVAVYDGVWVRGERSYETWILIDGVVAFHAPSEDLAARSFEEHERLGGGHSVIQR